MDALRLLGSFQLTSDDEHIAADQPRLQELIALLAIHPGEAISRVQIAYQIWPDSSEKQARANTRNLLHKLKQAWQGMESAVSVERSHVTWRRDAGISVDVQRFEALRAEAGQNDVADERIARLTDAVELYSGDLLPDCYADWALTERERLRGEYATVLEQLVDALLDQRRNEEALQQAKVLQRFDPLRESAYRLLMQIYGAHGDRAAALRVYHTCASTLQQELGVEPSPATEELRAKLLLLQEQTPSPNAPQAVQRQHLVGRHAEWQQLQDAWRRAQQGQALCVLLWGEAGIGKTRLAEELIDSVQRQGLTWASSRSYEVEGVLTYAPIAEWLRSPGIRPALEQIDDLWRVELARLLPELRAARPDLPPPGPMTESWQQQRFFQSIVRAMQVAPTPLLLHLDDIQWSDAETLILLQFLLHGAHAHPLLLVGGIRSEAAGERDELTAFVEALRHGDQLVELHLGPLSKDESKQLAEHTAGTAFDPSAVDALLASSEGHPLYLIEAVRSGLTAVPEEENAVSNTLERNGVAEMPPRIYSLLSIRLGQLSPIGQQVANIAAVIGRAFGYEILQAAAMLDEMALIDALDELWRRRIIREQGGDGYDFSHDRIREAAYQGISRARRRLYHRQVATAMEAVHGDDLDDVAGELGAHYARAGDSDAAYRYYRRAAEVAMSQHALPQAEAMLEAALRYVPDDPELRIALLQYQDQIFDRSLQFERWGENLDEELALLETMAFPDQRLALAYELSRSRRFANISAGDMAVDAAQRALSLAESIEDDDALALCYEVLGDALWRQARMAEARRAFEKMTLHTRQTGDRTAEGYSLGLEAQAGMFSGMPADELFDRLTRALSIAAERGDKAEIANLYGKLGYARTTSATGQFALIEQESCRALNLAQEIGDRKRESIAWSNLGRLYTHRGDYRLAEGALRSGGEVEREQPILWRNWVTLHYLGQLRMQMGCLESAQTKLAKACEELGQIGIRHFEVKARCDLGLVHHLSHDHREAQSELRRALALLDGYGDLRFEALANTRLGYVLEANGDLDEARLRYERGRDLHRQMGQYYYAMNALAGLARVAAAQSDEETAFRHVDTVWTTIAGQEMDATIETTRTLRTCYTIFDTNDDARAGAVLEMACDQLQKRAATIDDPDRIEKFWQIEEHCFFRNVARTNTECGAYGDITKSQNQADHLFLPTGHDL